MSRFLDRRVFLKSLGIAAGAGLVAGCAPEKESEPATADSEEEAMAGGELFRISLAQWSLHKAHFGSALEQSWEEIGRALSEDPRSMLQGELDPLDFPATARELELDGVEYVNTFFFDRARDEAYLADLEGRCDSEGGSR